MLVASPSFNSSELPNLCNNTSPCRSSASTSMPFLLGPTYTWSIRYRSLSTQAAANTFSAGGHGEPTKKTKSNTGNETNYELPSLPLPEIPTWPQWILSSIFWLALPTWKKFQSLQGVVIKVDNTVEVIETVVEATEKMVSKVAEDLPEGSAMKKAAIGLDRASVEVLRDVKAIDAFVDKVEEQVEEWKEKAKKSEKMDGRKIEGEEEEK